MKKLVTFMFLSRRGFMIQFLFFILNMKMQILSDNLTPVLFLLMAISAYGALHVTVDDIVKFFAEVDVESDKIKKNRMRKG